jgi:hypothetical protein
LLNVTASIKTYLSVLLVNILAKLEYTNPTGSGKDRLAKFILDGKYDIIIGNKKQALNPIHRTRKKEPFPSYQ